MVATAPTTSEAGALLQGERRAALLTGARAMLPWLVGVVPFGLVIGVSAAQADIPTLAGWLTGPLIFAGSAQVATIHLLDTGAAPAVAVLAGLAINVRLVLYSATMARHWQGTSPGWQALAAYFLVDPTLAVGVAGYERSTSRRQGHLHYLGGAALLWVAWVAAISAGASLGAALPQGLHLEFVIPLFLVGEVVPRVASRASRRGVAVAAGLAIVGGGVPLQLGVLLAIVGGTAAAMATREVGT
jgi:predicted branched-subunit amino acid permease